jgi:hypothetical protein
MEVHFTPEQEAQIARIAASSGLDAEDLVKNAALRLVEKEMNARCERKSGQPRDAAREMDPPIWEVIVDNMKDVPPEEFEKLPKDSASQIDHYLYGHPRR